MTRYRRFWSFYPVSLALGASSAFGQRLDRFELFGNIRAKMETNLAHLPDYTSRETVSRLVRGLGKRKFEPYYVLRLDVAYLGGQEILATPGSASFEKRRIREVVPDGAMRVGAFAGIAKAIFHGTGVEIRYEGSPRLAEPITNYSQYHSIPVKLKKLAKLGGIGCTIDFPSNPG
jgi:hypothetical protein